MPISSPYRTPLLSAPLPIKRGDNGQAVKRLQEWLVIRGLDVGVNPSAPAGTAESAGIDSDFGNMTDVACRNFAHDHNFPYTVVDAAFWAALTKPLLDALAFVPKPGSFGQALLEVARFYLQQLPVEARFHRGGTLFGEDNSGGWADQFNHGVVDPQRHGVPWCLGAVSEMVEQTARALNCAPPISTVLDGVRSLWVPRMVQEAQEKGVFLGGGAAVASAVKPGSVFFLRGTINGQPSHIHTGIVEAASGARILTLEGNTNDDGSSNGFEFIRRNREMASCDYAVIA